MTASTPAELVARWQQGDQQAATELFQRHVDRLVALAQTRLSSKLSQRIDPEDVVQSAYRSFFAGTRDGRYDLQRGGDLWQLLVTITLHKLHNQVRHNLAQKRAVSQEQWLDPHLDPGETPTAMMAQEPSPLEAVTLIDEVEQLMRGLNPEQRPILQLRLQGYDLREIANETQCSHRTVCRVLERVRQQLEQARQARLST
jgi:RNA polymerase sigma-70 factor (ECF subfamily)